MSDPVTVCRAALDAGDDSALLGWADALEEAGDPLAAALRACVPYRPRVRVSADGWRANPEWLAAPAKLIGSARKPYQLARPLVVCMGHEGLGCNVYVAPPYEDDPQSLAVSFSSRSDAYLGLAQTLSGPRVTTGSYLAVLSSRRHKSGSASFPDMHDFRTWVADQLRGVRREVIWFTYAFGGEHQAYTQREFLEIYYEETP